MIYFVTSAVRILLPIELFVEPIPFDPGQRNRSLPVECKCPAHCTMELNVIAEEDEFVKVEIRWTVLFFAFAQTLIQVSDLGFNELLAGTHRCEHFSRCSSKPVAHSSIVEVESFEVLSVSVEHFEIINVSFF